MRAKGIREWFVSIVVVAKRLLVILGAVFTLYLSVGSWFYGEWFFGLLWRGKFWEFNYWLDGLFFLINNHPYKIIATVVAAFVAAGLIGSYRDYLFPRIDRFAWWLAWGFAGAITIIAVLVYEGNAGLYEALEDLERTTATNEQTLRLIESGGTLAIPEPPIDFRYLDRARIEALYSQLEPEMVERQRTLKSETSLSGKAGIGAGPANAEIGTGKERGATSSFQRVEFSDERKCVEVMKFLIEKKTANYYSERSSWILKKSLAEIREETERRKKEPITLEGIEKLRLRPIWGAASKAEQERAKRQEEENQHRLSAELGSLAGLVFVGGQFSVNRGPGDHVILTRAFSNKPKLITFRVKVPTASGLDDLLEAGVFQGKVFGSVIKPLGDSGIVEVLALAIY